MPNKYQRLLRDSHQPNPTTNAAPVRRRRTTMKLTSAILSVLCLLVLALNCTCFYSVPLSQ
jgi:hypothetical protein